MSETPWHACVHMPACVPMSGAHALVLSCWRVLAGRSAFGAVAALLAFVVIHHDEPVGTVSGEVGEQEEHGRDVCVLQCLPTRLTR